MFVVGIAAGLWFATANQEQAAELRRATVLPVTNTVPDFSAVNHAGERIDATALEGEWSLVFFGFTHCPDVCPLTLQLLSEVNDRLAADGAAVVPRIVLVSVDPERDTPEALGNYLGYFGDGHLGITGELDEIRKLTDALGVFFEKTDLGDQGYTVDHSSVVLLMDPQARLRALFSTPHKIEDFVNDLPIVIASSQ